MKADRGGVENRRQDGGPSTWRLRSSSASSRREDVSRAVEYVQCWHRGLLGVLAHHAASGDGADAGRYRAKVAARRALR